jgi:succinate dehydrogenase / fumarate reductase membrane anchor subunit
MNYQTPLAKARGLGSAGAGSQDWWRQRVTAIALTPLSLWLGFSVSRLPGLDHGAVLAWAKHPWNSLLLLSFIIVAVYHAVLGLRVVIEDYVPSEPAKLIALLGVNLLFSFVGLAAVYATLRITFS